MLRSYNPNDIQRYIVYTSNRMVNLWLYINKYINVYYLYVIKS